MITGTFAPDQVIEVAYPFIREKVVLHDGEGNYETMSWKPGIRFEPDGSGDYESVGDGEGRQILTVVSVHKPGRFPLRIFYTRKWRDPDGKEFGRKGLRVATAEKFTRLSSGYAHPYRVEHQTALAA